MQLRVIPAVVRMSMLGVFDWRPSIGRRWTVVSMLDMLTGVRVTCVVVWQTHALFGSGHRCHRRGRCEHACCVGM